MIVYPVIQLSNGLYFIKLSLNTRNSSENEIKTIAEKNTKDIEKILQRIDSLVIGPGAGRDPIMIATLSNVISYAIEKEMPLVIDGDGLWVVTENPSLLEKYSIG